MGPKPLESYSGANIQLETESSEGTLVKEIELIIKEKEFEKRPIEEIRAEIQHFDDIFHSKQIKENFALEPSPTQLEDEPNIPAVVNVEKTQSTSLKYSQVEAAVKEKQITLSEGQYSSKDKEDIVATQLESYLPVTVTEQSDERLYPLISDHPEKEKSILTAPSRKASTTLVSIHMY